MQGELAEFDETLPLDDERERADPPAEADAPELAALMKQVAPLTYRSFQRLSGKVPLATQSVRTCNYLISLRIKSLFFCKVLLVFLSN